MIDRLLSEQAFSVSGKGVAVRLLLLLAAKANWLGERLVPGICRAQELLPASEDDANSQAMQRELEQWRRNRALYSEDDTHRFLKTYHLELGDLEQYIHRHLLLATDGEPLTELSSDHVAVLLTNPSLLRSLVSELVFSGALDTIIESAFPRVVAPLAVGFPECYGHAPLREEAGFANALGCTPDEYSWAIRIEEAYSLARRQTLTSCARDAELERLGNSVDRLLLRRTILPTRDQAAELALCCREAGEDVRIPTFKVQDFEILRARAVSLPGGHWLRSVQKGEVKGPFKCDDGFVVYEVFGWLPPTLDDD